MMCNRQHIMDQYEVFDGGPVVYASASLTLEFSNGERLWEPDFGLYLDGSWLNYIKWDNTFIGWPDFGVPNDSASTINLITKAIHRSVEEVVEVGCLGGHGRTGTTLAIMTALATSLDHEECIQRVRELYCPAAIETKMQERYIEIVTKMRNEVLDA